MNYFDLFEIPVSILVDKAAVSKKYVELQKKFHPDFYTREQAEAQEEALEMSSAVNKAMKVFKSPDATLQYLLELKGLVQKDEKYDLPPHFLMEVMELNETLSDDSATAVENLGKTIFAEVQPLVEHYNDATVTAEELLRLKDYYYKKKYLQRILERLDG